MNIELAGDGTRPQEKEEEESVVVTIQVLVARVLDLLRYQFQKVLFLPMPSRVVTYLSPL